VYHFECGNFFPAFSLTFFCLTLFLGFIPFDHLRKLFVSPPVIRNPGLERGRHAERLVPEDEVVREGVQGKSMLVIVELLA